MKTPLIDRLMSRVEVSSKSECWIWVGAVERGGYGRIRVSADRVAYVHRVTYEAFLGGPIGDGLEIDHLCRQRACVNPAHLEPVTHAENNRRAESFHALKTHCPRGHAYDTENTLISVGKRYCRACRRTKSAERRRRPDVKAYQAMKAREYRRRDRSPEVDIHGEKVTS